METLPELERAACPAIRLRLAREVTHDPDAASLSPMLYESPTVQKVLAWQQADGYFGTRFHTPPSKSPLWSHEGCVRYLLEMGMTKEDPPLQKALDALLKNGWDRECKGGAADLFGAGMIRAALFAQARREELPLVQEWVQNALAAFWAVDEAESFDQIAKPYRDKWVFQQGQILPTIYHLRILAYTTFWRNEATLLRLKQTYSKLYQWLPLPQVYIKNGSQLVAPACNITHAYNSDMGQVSDFLWLQFYELSARMEMLHADSPFLKHANAPYVLSPNSRRSFFNWSGYSGLALEENWRENRAQSDLAFRWNLIQTYMG